MTTTDKRIGQFLFAVAAIFYAVTCTPSNASKQAGGLHLNIPVEMPDAVQFSWTGGQAGTTYSLYRRKQGETNWERIALGLTGVSGMTVVDGFTLDKTYDYEIRAEEP